MRIQFLKVLFIFILLAIVIRLFYWQVIRSDDLSAMAEGQHLRSITIDAPRGSILASDGSLLASNKPAFLLYGLPKVIKDKEAVVNALVQILPIGATNVDDQITKDEKLKLASDLKSALSQDFYWVILDKDVDLATKNKIDQLKLEGIGFEQASSRFYPEASSSAHILGFVGSDAYGNQAGYFGLEGFYDRELKGVGGVLTEEKDARGQPILFGKFFQKEPKPGRSLVLNIDRTVQFIVETKLKEGMEKYGAKAASAVVMDPKTGAVLALASYPSYDPANYGEYPRDYYKDSVVADAYEPGSTFKVLNMAAAINENVLDPGTKCDICSGPVPVGGFLIRTWNNQYRPDSTMTDVIIHSDNTGMVFVGKRLGLDKMYDYVKKFGFGDITGVDLQDETSPDIRPKSEWKDIDLATASFGQGIAVTAMQMVRAVAALANGGYLMEPQVVHYIVDGDQKTEIKPRVIGQPISQQTAKTVTEMMVQAVNKGEAQFVKIKGFKVAGKTGTAQIPVAGHYDPNKTIASFVGFAPADDPKFVMLVRYTEPSASIFGAETAAPTFFSIAKELFTYYGIAPTENE
ncbi:penicillin-binding protein 2 [Candidatus Daviesbacteria bacterium]|nr:penicillin-binding protein 2 [Candidatus Daviesbacteria bacterium]